MKILVTGGAGFIGSHAVEHLLANGHLVTVLDDFNDSYDPAIKHGNLASLKGFPEIRHVDIRNCEQLHDVFQAGRFDAVIHLAARAGVRPSIRQPRLYTEVNVGGTQNLLELVREFRVSKFIFASSSSVYGINQSVPFREDDLVSRPISPYAATKLAGEALCHVYHHLYEIDVVCLRFFTVYGPRQRPDLAIHQFTRSVYSGEPITLFGDGTSQRDYTYIDDILQGMMACLERRFDFEIINLGDSRTIPLRELVSLIEDATGKSADIRCIPAQPGDVPVTHADISKARRLLGYNPQVPIEVGIARFVEWYERSLLHR